MSARTRAVAAALLTLTLGACSDARPQPEGPAETVPTPSTAPSSAASSTTANPSEAPSAAEPTPDVAPATGEVIKVKNLRVNAPKGWFVSDPLGMQHAASPPELGTILTVFRFPNSELFTIDELADDERRFELGPGAKRLDDLELDGQQVYHLTGQLNPGEHTERFGTIVDDERVSIEFGFANGEPKAVRERLMRSVLATARIG